MVNRLKEAKQDNTIDDIDPSEWYQWFKALNTKENQKNNKEFREKTLSIVEKKHFFAERFVKILDSHISSAEITKACYKLKHNKACGVDSISNEILKSIAQLFTLVINERLVQFLDENKVIVLNQIGFQRGHRTADHLFILNTIINSYFKKGKMVYVCFIDFSKAYDTVWRVGLFYKLIKYGLSLKFIKIDRKYVQ